jgi:two-component system LytT family sensor kinase
MKRRLLLFTGAFTGFYLLAVLTRQMPGVIHGRLGILTDTHALHDWLHFSGDVLCCYLPALGVYLALNYFYPGKRIAALALAACLIAIAGFFAAFWWTGLMENSALRLSNFFRGQVIPEGLSIIFAISFYLFRYAQFKELQQIATVAENKQAELSFLRSQVNPHFLFNNLNNIYSLVAFKSEHALPAIAGLSELLRYMLYNGQQMVRLQEELSYIEKYVALQQLRFEHPTNIRFDVSGDTSGRQLPPLLLIPFVENAFKHGDPTAAAEWLRLSIQVKAYGFTFICVNRKAAGIRKDVTGGIGITNVKKRLALLYPARDYCFHITDDEDLFTVKLDLHGN